MKIAADLYNTSSSTYTLVRQLLQLSEDDSDKSNFEGLSTSIIVIIIISALIVSGFIVTIIIIVLVVIFLKRYVQAILLFCIVHVL